MLNVLNRILQAFDLVDVDRDVGIKRNLPVHESFSLHEALLVGLSEHGLRNVELAFRLVLRQELTNGVIVYLKLNFANDHSFSTAEFCPVYQ